MDTKKLYHLKLHEQMRAGDDQPIQIMRVPGGWIYTFFSYLNIGETGYTVESQISNSVFVPFSEV